jgi:hypothetical protein
MRRPLIYRVTCRACGTARGFADLAAAEEYRTRHQRMHPATPVELVQVTVAAARDLERTEDAWCAAWKRKTP